ncbi:MAG TPA: T9SS type A sorting domain-containing protein, partial [Ignavibacteriaceae bacterium]|nr:T9SS type A sorting domain-containing protein [Ignavibacteriaceae bacterium]
SFGEGLGEAWEAFGFVPGFGTTTEPKSYSFIDENVTTGTYKYRLKQIDFDGTYTYSNEIEIAVDFTPKEFVLYQNYPNPFNPSTKIKYSIPNVETHRDASLQMVTLKVYDILGNEVATLVNEEKQPGVYEVEFNSQFSHSGAVRNLSSGVYFYQLKAGSFVQTKKMILTK